MSRTKLVRFLIVSLLLVGAFSVAAAQGGTLSYGTTVNETYNGSPVVYTFAGSENDLITVYVIGDGALEPTLALSRSNGQPVMFTDGDALTPMSNDARVTVKLPATDTFIVTLNSQNATAGAYLLSLSVAAPGTSITLENSTTLSLAPGGPDQQFVIPANAGEPQTISIRALQPGGSFVAQVHAPDGQIVAAIAGGLEAFTFTVPASDASYMLTVGALSSGAATQIEIALGGASASVDGSTDAPDPVATEDAEPTDPNACVITATGVNVRSGPGTDYQVIGSMGEGSQFIATGQNSGWFNGTFSGQSAWVAASVVTATGPCANLPLANAPALPVATVVPVDQTSATATPVATIDSSQNQQPTTSAPTTAPPIPTGTPTVAPTTTPFTVTTLSCNYAINNGADVNYRVEGGPSVQFTIDVRFGSTVYSKTFTTNQQGFRTGNENFGQVGNSNYTAYIVYNGVDVASTEC